ncbi:hypothetical protein GCM10027051_02910 [Niabella terrae]
MEIVNKRCPYYKLPVTLLLTVVLVWCCLSATPDPSPNTAYAAYKSQDSLTACLYVFFDQLDAHPELADRADSLMALIWRPPETKNERLAFYDLQINLAYHLLQSGQIQASTHWYEQALDFYQQQKDEQLRLDMNIEEYVGKPLGNNYTRMGDFSKAVFIQQTMITAAVDHDRANMLPALYANFATTHFYMQHFDSVLQLADRGLRTLQQPADPIAILLYNLKAAAWLERGHTDSAAHWNALALGRGPLNRSWYLNALTDKARILAEQGRPYRALHFLKQAWYYSAEAAPRQRARIANEIAASCLKQQSADTAISWFSRALDFFKRDSKGLYPDFTVTSSLFGLAAAYEMKTNADSCSYWMVQAVLNDYYTQQLIGVADFTDNSIYTNEKETERAIVWHHRSYAATGQSMYLWKALWMTELSKGRKLIYEQQRTRRWQQSSQIATDQFEALRNDYLLLAQQDDTLRRQQIKNRIRSKEYQLSLTENQFGQTLEAPSFTGFQNRLLVLATHQTIISYYAIDNLIYRITIDSSGLDQQIDSSARLDEIYAFADRYFYQGPAAFNNDPTAYNKEAFRLYQRLLDPIPAGRPLIIAPSGALYHLPFEALTLRADQPEFLGQAHSLSYQYTLLSLLSDPNVQEAEGLEVFSLEHPHLGFPALPFAREEAAYLKSDFGARCHQADTASDSVFLASLNHNRIVHVASHAVAGDAAQPAFILLKQKLLLGQIRYLTTQCPLVVLAGCETGNGIYLQHEGPLSLGRAFLSKGVGGVVATRWQADDRATSEMMRFFYEALHQLHRPSQALQAARAAYLEQRTSVAERNPWYWAGLFYQGGDQQLNIAVEKNRYNYLPVIGLLVLLVAAYAGWKYYRKKNYNRGVTNL